MCLDYSMLIIDPLCLAMRYGKGAVRRLAWDRNMFVLIHRPALAASAAEPEPRATWLLRTQGSPSGRGRQWTGGHQRVGWRPRRAQMEIAAREAQCRAAGSIHVDRSFAASLIRPSTTHLTRLGDPDFYRKGSAKDPDSPSSARPDGRK